MKPIKIAPSILAWDLGDLAGAVEICEKGGGDQIHLDVIDGHFAPNITFGPGTVKSLRSRTDLYFDTHLMVDQPLLYAERFLDAGADLLTLHTETLTGPSFDEAYSIVRKRGKDIGLAIKPSSEIPGWAVDRMSKLKAIIVMTVNPGFSGQSMDMSVMPKLMRVSSLIEEGGYDTEVEVDGGVEPENVNEVVKRGGTVLVAGAGVFAKKDPVSAISVLRERAESSRGSMN